jgi:hypothetical protein
MKVPINPAPTISAESLLLGIAIETTISRTMKSYMYCPVERMYDKSWYQRLLILYEIKDEYSEIELFPYLDMNHQSMNMTATNTSLGSGNSNIGSVQKSMTKSEMLLQYLKFADNGKYRWKY